MDIINPQVSRYLSEYYTDLTEELKDFRRFCEVNHVPLIKKDTESFLINILKIKSPVKILEIGTGAGYSATLFARTCSNAKITTLEMIDKRIESARKNFRDYCVDGRIDLIEGDASVSLKALEQAQNEYDFIFIDCAKSRYLEFFNSALKMTDTGGLIICDNVLLDGRTASDEFIEKRRDKTSTMRMREFIDYLRKNETVTETSLLSIGDGLTLTVV